MNFGFMFNEYTDKRWYFELFKIFEKALIILFLQYYAIQVTVKAVLIFVVIFIYGAAAVLLKPYKIEKINNMDGATTQVCSITIILGMFIKDNQFFYLQVVAIVLIILINGCFICWMLGYIIAGYIEKFAKAIEKKQD